MHPELHSEQKHKTPSYHLTLQFQSTLYYLFSSSLSHHAIHFLATAKRSEKTHFALYAQYQMTDKLATGDQSHLAFSKRRVGQKQNQTDYSTRLWVKYRKSTLKSNLL